MTGKIGWALALAFLAGCNSGLRDELHPTGSATAVATERGNAVVAVNVLEGSISRVELATGAVEELVLGAEPSRIAPFGDHVLVTLRGERAVAVVDTSGDRMKVVKMLPTGAEPFGVVADESGKSFFVAVSQANEVVEYDRDFKVVRTFKVPDEPTWLALHPSQRALFAVSNRKGSATRIDLETGEKEPLVPPPAVRPIDMDDGIVDLDHRYTGDPAITPDGNWLVIPGLHADTTTPVETPSDDRPVQNGYASSGVTMGRINPSLVVFPLDRDGERSTESKPFLVFLAAQAGRRDIVRSYPTSVTADPEGGQVLVTMEASKAVVFVELRPFKGQGNSNSSFGGEGSFFEGDHFDTSTFTEGPGGEGSFVRQAFPAEGGFTDRPVVAVETVAEGPDGVLFVQRDQAWVHSFIDRTVAPLPYEIGEDSLNQAAENHFVSPPNVKAVKGTLLTTPSLPEDVELGMRLFYGGRDARMAADGAGVTCSTCHMGGRDDGFTWTFDRGARQTPSLAGTVSETAPVTWTDSVDSVATEAQLTSELRMGGKGLNITEAAAIQAFVDFGRAVDVGGDDLDAAAVARGKATFERADVACSECHSGARYTDNQSHDLFGLEAVNTPTLTGVKATAPYLHDGSAATLDQVLILSANGLMGDTSMLTPAELADLKTYLESL